MDKFWELFAESLIIQGVLALMFSVVICYMYVSGMEVPQELVALISLILGYFFGAKNAVAQQKVIRAMRDYRDTEVS
jgi:uncharacterized membrane protein YfcA